MIESLFVFGVLGVLIGLGVAAASLSLEGLLVSGLACIGFGLVIGVLGGTLYHLMLYRRLLAHGPLPRTFWWHPQRYHAELESHEWRAILPWFVLGAAGFVLIVLGALIVLLGVLKAR